MSKPPTFVECSVCGREFGSKSIQIHEPQCLQRLRQTEIKDSDLNRNVKPKKKKKTSPNQSQVNGGFIIGDVPISLTTANKKINLPRIQTNSLHNFSRRPTTATLDRPRILNPDFVHYDMSLTRIDFSSSNSMLPGMDNNQNNTRGPSEAIDASNRSPFILPAVNSGTNVSTASTNDVNSGSKGGQYKLSEGSHGPTKLPSTGIVHITSVTDAWLGDPNGQRGSLRDGYEIFSRQSGKLCDETTSCTNTIHSVPYKCGGEACCDCGGHLCLPKMNLLQTLHCCCHFFEADAHVMPSDLPSYIPDVPKDKIPSRHPSSGDIPVYLSASSSLTSLHGTPIEINADVLKQTPQLIHRTPSQPPSDIFVTPSTSDTNVQTQPSEATSQVERDNKTGFFSYCWFKSSSKEIDSNAKDQTKKEQNSSKANVHNKLDQSLLSVITDSCQDISVIYRNASPIKPSMAAGLSIGERSSVPNLDRANTTNLRSSPVIEQDLGAEKSRSQTKKDSEPHSSSNFESDDGTATQSFNSSSLGGQNQDETDSSPSQSSSESSTSSSEEHSFSSTMNMMQNAVNFVFNFVRDTRDRYEPPSSLITSELQQKPDSVVNSSNLSTQKIHTINEEYHAQIKKNLDNENLETDGPSSKSRMKSMSVRFDMEIDHIIPLKEAKSSEPIDSNTDLRKKFSEELNSPTCILSTRSEKNIGKNPRCGSSYEAGSGTDTDDEDSSIETRPSRMTNLDPCIVVSSRTLLRRNKKARSRQRANSSLEQKNVQIKAEDGTEEQLPSPDVEHINRPLNNSEVLELSNENHGDCIGATCMGYDSYSNSEENTEMVIQNILRQSDISEDEFKKVMYDSLEQQQEVVDISKCEGKDSRFPCPDAFNDLQVMGTPQSEIFKSHYKSLPSKHLDLDQLKSEDLEEFKVNRKALTSRRDHAEDAVSIWEGQEGPEIESDEEDELHRSDTNKSIRNYFPLTDVPVNSLPTPNKALTKKILTTEKNVQSTLSTSAKKKTPKGEEAFQSVMANIIRLQELQNRKALSLQNYCKTPEPALEDKPHTKETIGSTKPTTSSSNKKPKTARPKSYKNDPIYELLNLKSFGLQGLYNSPYIPEGYVDSSAPSLIKSNFRNSASYESAKKLQPFYYTMPVSQKVSVKKVKKPTTPTKNKEELINNHFRSETANRLAFPKWTSVQDSFGDRKPPSSAPISCGSRKPSQGPLKSAGGVVMGTQTPRDQERLLTPTILRKQLKFPSVETPTQTPRSSKTVPIVSRQFPLVPKPKKEADVQKPPKVAHYGPKGKKSAVKETNGRHQSAPVKTDTAKVKKIQELTLKTESSSDNPSSILQEMHEPKVLKSKSLLKSENSIKRSRSASVRFLETSITDVARLSQPSTISAETEPSKSVSFCLDPNIPKVSSSHSSGRSSTNLNAAPSEDQVRLKKVKVHSTKSADQIELSYRRKSSQTLTLHPSSSTKLRNEVRSFENPCFDGLMNTNENPPCILKNMITFPHITMITPTDPPMDRDYIDLNIIVRRKKRDGNFPKIEEIVPEISPENFYLVIDEAISPELTTGETNCDGSIQPQTINNPESRPTDIPKNLILSLLTPYPNDTDHKSATKPFESYHFGKISPKNLQNLTQQGTNIENQTKVSLRKKSTNLLETIRSMKVMDIETCCLELLLQKDPKEQSLSDGIETEVSATEKSLAEDVHDNQLQMTLAQLI